MDYDFSGLRMKERFDSVNLPKIEPDRRVSAWEARWAFMQDSRHRPGVEPKGGDGVGRAKKKGGGKYRDEWSGYYPAK